jgi:hypothetical protein
MYEKKTTQTPKENKNKTQEIEFSSLQPFFRNDGKKERSKIKF